MLKLLPRTQRILSRCSYFFSSQYKESQQKFDHDNALLSSKIIKQILTPSNFTAFEFKNLTNQLITDSNGSSKQTQSFLILPLRERILKIIKDSTTNHQSKDQLNKLFVKGLDLNKQIWTQSRINDGSFQQIDEKTQLIVDLTKFCPTEQVTRQVFEQITAIIKQDQCDWIDPKANRLMTGYFGISKTFSFVLHSILSGYITKYRCRMLKRNPVAKIAQDIINIPKIVYLSIQNSNSFIKGIQNRIQLQCPEIYQNINEYTHQNISSYSINDKKINVLKLKTQFEKFNIPTLLIIDQIHVLASVIRERQYSKNQLKCYTSFIRKQPDQHLQRKYQSAMKICNLLLNISNRFHRNIFISSVSIEKWIQHEMNLSKEGKRHLIPIDIIDYPQLYSRDAVKYGLADYFIFEFCTRFMRNSSYLSYKNFDSSVEQDDIKLKNQIRFSLLQIMKQNYLYFPIPHLIRRSFEFRPKSMDLKIIMQKIQSTKQDKTKLKQLFEEYFKYSCKKGVQMLIAHFKIFLSQKSDEKLEKLIQELYLAAIEKLNAKQNLDNEFLSVNLSQDQWTNLVNKDDNLVFQFDEKNKLCKILLPIQLVIKALTPQYEQIVDRRYKHTQSLYYILDYSEGTLGSIYQKHFLKILRTKGTVIKQKSTSQQLYYRLDRQTFIQSNIYPKCLGINYIPKKTQIRRQNYSILSQLKPYFQILDKKKHSSKESFIVLPCLFIQQNSHENILNQGIKEQISDFAIQSHNQNKCFDFIDLFLDKIQN